MCGTVCVCVTPILSSESHFTRSCVSAPERAESIQRGRKAIWYESVITGNRSRRRSRPDVKGIQLPSSPRVGGNFLMGNGCSSAIREKQIDFLMKFHFSFFSSLPLCTPTKPPPPPPLRHTHTCAHTILCMANCAETLC